MKTFKQIISETRPTPAKMEFLPGDQVVVKGKTPGVVRKQFAKYVSVLPDEGGALLKVKPGDLKKKVSEADNMWQKIIDREEAFLSGKTGTASENKVAKSRIRRAKNELKKGK